MKKVRVEDSIGMVLGHDMTKIVPGDFKGPAFKKGHIVTQEDIEVLKNMGKDHIFLLELNEDQIHENEAAVRLANAAAGKGIHLTEPMEGKVSFKAEYDGLLKVRKELLYEINGIEHISMASLQDNTPVKKGQLVAGTRIIPLITERYKVEEVEKSCIGEEAVIQIKPYKKMKLGVVITGNEVFYGRIEDKFAPVFKAKMAEYGAELMDIKFAPDDAEKIKTAILEHIQNGADGVVTGGGMSVDPDDVTPEGIRLTGAEVISYGAPVLPGAMFMMAYLGDKPIMGLPACGMYHKTTIFDLIFPRVLAGERIKKRDIAALGYGGLCTQCKICTYPACHFGKA
ncbi:MAG: molybdopterin-binding protein [Lutispora sp.]|nr:molybdopterin-binding protein [Lutispora sp.]MDD4834998.1 molybdopterin-binding protein [Lutispora sp.]